MYIPAPALHLHRSCSWPGLTFVPSSRSASAHSSRTGSLRSSRTGVSRSSAPPSSSPTCSGWSYPAISSACSGRAQQNSSLPRRRRPSHHSSRIRWHKCNLLCPLQHLGEHIPCLERGNCTTCIQDIPVQRPCIRTRCHFLHCPLQHQDWGHCLASHCLRP